MYLFVILVISWTTGGQSYTHLTPYNSVAECQAAGSKLPAGPVWRCAPMIVTDTNDSIIVKFP